MGRPPDRRHARRAGVGGPAGRRAHREWLEAALAGPLAARGAAARENLLARLIGVCGVELWLVLRRDAGLSVAAARTAVADLIAATLAHPSPES